MKTNITKFDESETYTGDIYKWPNGLYTCLTNNRILIQVRHGNGLCYDTEQRTVFPRPIKNVASPYRRIPGFTGRITAIEFEREGDQ